MKTPLISLAALSFAAFATTADARPVGADLELAFVVDASASIDEEETRLQRQGYAAALANPRVVSAITGGILRTVAVTYIEFGGPGCVRQSVPWTLVRSLDDAKAFGAAILANEKYFCPGGNSIGEAVAFAAKSMNENNIEGTRRVIDVSGDGPNTTDPPIEFVREAVIATGVTINGLVIERPSFPDLDAYYRQAITGGPGSFVIKAESRRTFADAILKKLILEIAGNGAPVDGLAGTLTRGQ